MNPSSEMQALLDSLQALEAPSAISWWPPAWGWWVLAAGIIALAVTAWRVFTARRVRRRWRQSAVARLEQLEQRAASCNGVESQAVLCELSVLLRQVALLQRPRSEVARLHGSAWLAMLDKLAGTTSFSQGVGRCLLDVPYRKVAVERAQLLQTVSLARDLIRRCTDPRRPVQTGGVERA